MIIAVSSFQEGPFSKRFSDTLKRKAPFTWLISVLDGRLKAVVSILSRVVRTEEKSSNDVQFMLYYMTKLPLTICVDFSMVVTSFTHRLFIGNSQ